MATLIAVVVYLNDSGTVEIDAAPYSGLAIFNFDGIRITARSLRNNESRWTCLVNHTVNHEMMGPIAFPEV